MKVTVYSAPGFGEPRSPSELPARTTVGLVLEGWSVGDVLEAAGYSLTTPSGSLSTHPCHYAQTGLVSQARTRQTTPELTPREAAPTRHDWSEFAVVRDRLRNKPHRDHLAWSLDRLPTLQLPTPALRLVGPPADPLPNSPIRCSGGSERIVDS